jgi:hypothetical protein
MQLVSTSAGDEYANLLKIKPMKRKRRALTAESKAGARPCAAPSELEMILPVRPRALPWAIVFRAVGAEESTKTT